MADNKLFGNSEQLDDTISRAVAIEEVEALADTMSICLSADECSGMRGMKERVLIALNEMPSAQQWISCEERLPEKDGEYLVTMLYFGEKTVEVDKFSHYETDDEHNGEPFWMYGYDNVIAWMPCPKAWKGDKHEAE